jgi:uncharacterized protein YeaO (DUF488 family)
LAVRNKETDAAIDEWMKEIAPSTEPRKWFGHDPERWHEFGAATDRRAGSVPTN